MVERYSPTAPERQALLSHFEKNFPSRDCPASAEDLLNTSQNTSSTQIDNTSKDNSAIPKSSSHPDMKKDASTKSSN